MSIKEYFLPVNDFDRYYLIYDYFSITIISFFLFKSTGVF